MTETRESAIPGGVDRPDEGDAGRAIYLMADALLPEALFDRIEAELKVGRRVWVSGELFGTLASRFGRERGGRRWVEFAPRPARRAEWPYRTRDVIGSLLALVGLSPLLLLLALLVKRSSPGPVLYAAAVVGRRGHSFTWFKFRSMRPVPRDEDERKRVQQFRSFAKKGRQGSAPGKSNKVIDESRVTPVGRVLRKYSLDELPQLLNVLRGQMSLVGPRPCLPYEAELFPPWARRRFDLRPGLTGLWQVFGRGRVGFNEALAMDFYYVCARSPWLDLRLIVQTVAVVLRGQGAR